MEYLLAHLSQALIVLGLIFLVIEVLVFGFSTFILFFIGLATIVTGGLMMINIIPETVLSSLVSTALISAIITIVSWKPMKRIQNKVELKQVDNGIIGYQFTLTEDLPIGKTVTYHYSGIIWKVKAREALAMGDEVKIIKMEVGLLTVERVA
ncbi:NfeD family protein [Psychromonas sp. RZ22]|uniref:NfeD family protein n=1 Tax=Psychromonas algarum TaxID=2555643 RepID=UPI001067EF9F|nr:NfeD family protein [Psychromonas sp. RZ22]TEW56120.1 NfeD family protein [Psychromonas sp. RZ22]